MSASPNRAILLASLLMLSVAPISGIASAEITRGSGNAQYNVSASSGNVTDGGVIFQGEEDITLRNTTKASGNQVVAPASLTRDVATGGIPLSLPIPQDQTLGEYKNRAGFSVTVTTPRITEFEINNDDGQDVSGGTLIANQNATVNIEFNFEDSEQINLIIESENGVDVTNEFSANTTINASVANNVPEVDDTAGSVTIPIDPSNVDEGEYTFVAEGDDDLDFGQASEARLVTIQSGRGGGGGGGAIGVPQPAPPAFVEFNNTTVPTDSSTVTVDRAQFGNQSIPAGEFVVVLHQTDDGTFTGNIGPKIGESFILSAESRSDIIVNLGPLVSQNDTVTQLENSQTLIAVLHRANRRGATNHGAPLIRNGSRVSDRAQITAQVQPTETETGPQNDGFGVFTAFVALLVTFLGFKRMHQE